MTAATNACRARVDRGQDRGGVPEADLHVLEVHERREHVDDPGLHVAEPVVEQRLGGRDARRVDGGGREHVAPPVVGQDHVRGRERPGGDEDAPQRADDRGQLEEREGGAPGRRRVVDLHLDVRPARRGVEGPQDVVVQPGQVLRPLRAVQVEEVDRVQPELRHREGDGAPRARRRVAVGGRAEAHVARDVARIGEDAGRPGVHPGLRLGARRRAVAGPDRGRDVDAEAVREAHSAPGGLHDMGELREAALAVGVERARRTVVVALHGLVHALGEREVGDRVADVGDAAHRAVDGGGLARLCVLQPARSVALGDPERVVGVPGLADVVEQREPVDHVARLDLRDRLVVLELLLLLLVARGLLGRRAFLVPRHGRLLEPVRGEREELAQLVDEDVHLLCGLVVQRPLELVAEQRAEALALLHPLDDVEREPHALRGEVHLVAVGVRRIGRRDVGVAQHGRRHRVVHGRRVHVARVARVGDDAALAVRVEDRDEIVVQRHRREALGVRVRPEVLHPAVRPEVDPAVAPAGHRGGADLRLLRDLRRPHRLELHVE